MKLTIGTYNGNPYSIHIERNSYRPDSSEAWKATVYIVDETGEVIDSFIETNGECRKLRDVCLKRIVTESSE